MNTAFDPMQLLQNRELQWIHLVNKKVQSVLEDRARGPELRKGAVLRAGILLSGRDTQTNR